MEKSTSYLIIGPESPWGQGMRRSVYPPNFGGPFGNLVHPLPPYSVNQANAKVQAHPGYMGNGLMGITHKTNRFYGNVHNNTTSCNTRSSNFGSSKCSNSCCYNDQGLLLTPNGITRTRLNKYYSFGKKKRSRKRRGKRLKKKRKSRKRRRKGNKSTRI